MKTMLNVKMDKALKEKAQKVAKELGLPLSTIVKNYLNEFVDERRVVFSDHPMPNAETRKRLDKALRDVRKGSNLSPSFKNTDEALRYLDSQSQ
ncbi:MAG: DUF6364 family protein [bacterium]|nr:DUF6364 family protein [bacterium]